MAMDSSQAIPHSQISRHVSTYSNHTLPLQSQESLPFNPMETSGSPVPGQITTPTSERYSEPEGDDGSVMDQTESRLKSRPRIVYAAAF